MEFHFVLPCQSKTLACRASVNPLVSPASLNKRTHPPFPCLLSAMCVSRPCGRASICRVVCACRAERAQGVVLPAQRMHAAASQLLRLCFVRCLESSFISSLHIFTYYWTLRSQRRGWGPQRTVARIPSCQCARAGRVTWRQDHAPCSLITHHVSFVSLGLTLEWPVHFVLPYQSKTLACRASGTLSCLQQVSTKGWRRERAWLASTSTWAGR